MNSNQIVTAALQSNPNTLSMLNITGKLASLETAVTDTITVLTNGIKNGKVTIEEAQDMTKEGFYTMLKKQNVDKSLLHQNAISEICRMISNTLQWVK